MVVTDLINLKWGNKAYEFVIAVETFDRNDESKILSSTFVCVGLHLLVKEEDNRWIASRVGKRDPNHLGYTSTAQEALDELWSYVQELNIELNTLIEAGK